MKPMIYSVTVRATKKVQLIADDDEKAVERACNIALDDDQDVEWEAIDSEVLGEWRDE